MVDTLVVFSDDGLRAAFYRTDAHMPDEIPPEAEPISEADWQAFLAGGKRWNGSELEPYVPPPLPTPMPDITDGQFGMGLWIDKVIGYEEYLGFVGTGALPATLEALLALLPDDETDEPTPRKIARGDLMGRTRFIFANPLVETIRGLMEQRDPIWTPEYLRARWLVWSTL